MQVVFSNESTSFLVKPPERIFQTVQLRGDEFDSSKMQYFETLIKEIYKRKDTINGVMVYFNANTEYHYVVRALDLCHICDMRYFSLNPEKNLFWACYEPAKIYKPYHGEIHHCRSGSGSFIQNISFKENFVSQCKSYFNFLKDFHNKEGQFDSEFSHTIHNY